MSRLLVINFVMIATERHKEFNVDVESKILDLSLRIYQWKTHLANVIQCNIQVMFHWWVLLFIFSRARVGPCIERLGSEWSCPWAKISPKVRAQSPEPGKWVICYHSVHSIIEKRLKK